LRMCIDWCAFIKRVKCETGFKLHSTTFIEVDFSAEIRTRKRRQSSTSKTPPRKLCLY